MPPTVSQLIQNSKHSFFGRESGITKNDIETVKREGLHKISTTSTESLKRVADYFQTTLDDLVFLNQSHSNNCITFDETEPGIKKNLSPLIFDGDAIVSNITGKVLCITTADCAPILLWDKKEKISGAIHSGWRGALNNILETSLDSFENLGSNRQNIIAILGPTISRNVYEVTDEFLTLFKERDKNYSTFFKRDKVLTFDLPNFLINKLKILGVSKIDFLEHCTFSNSEKYFSHRRATVQGKTEMKRQISAIRA